MSQSLSPQAAIVIAYGLNLLLMVTFLSVIALVIGRTILRHEASARYLLYLTALSGILLSPLVVACLSKVHYGLLFFALPTAAQPQFCPTATTLTASGSWATGIAPLALGSSWWGHLSLLLPIWGVGTVWGLARFVRGWHMVAQLRRTVHPVDACELGGLLEQVQRTLQVTAPPVFTSDCVTTPVAIGLLRPAVILPNELLAALTPTQLRHVLLHECAHVAFHHAFGGVVQRMVNTIYWPHPLVVALCRELARAREEVCDDVASQEDGAACYARTLLTIAQGLSTAPQYASALALLGPETSLEQRISGLLNPRRNRMVGVKRGKLWAVTGVVTLTMALAAAVRVVADDAKAQRQTDQQHAAQTKRSSAPTVVAAGAALAPIVVEDGVVGAPDDGGTGAPIVIEDGVGAKAQGDSAGK
jgi:beta-lactamase regulating signal transducer with metallopeptidase domain